MAKRMMIDAIHAAETRVVIAEDNKIIDFDFTTHSKQQIKGNIYLAKITRVEPSLQAAFVEYGGGKQGFLPFSEIHPDYYQIPMSDREKLMEEASNEPDEDEDEDDLDEAEDVEASVDEPETSDENKKADSQDSEKTTDEAPEEKSTADAQEDNDADDTDDAKKNTKPRRAKAKSEPAASVISDEIVQPDDVKVTHENEVKEAAEGDEASAATEKSGDDDDNTADHSENDEDGKGKRNRRRGRRRNTRGRKNASSDEDGDVETLPSEEEETQRRKQKKFFRRYKIQEVIRRGQIVLVQVIKEERGNKGVSLTTYLSLAGRYCVLMPNSPKDGGISRKIASAEDRKRLKAISNELRLAKGMSVIIRTAGMDRTRAEIKRDYDYLVKVWNGIREATLKSTAPALVYEESDITKRAIRDQYTSDIDEIIIEGEEGYKAAREFMKLLLPSHLPKIKQYKEATPLFYAYDIEDQLLSMHDPVVKLKSGGYIVMDPTEALISIDVNSGRSTGERNVEETAYKTNLEAAAAVARQLRLRDLAGLIVIDFIDMFEARHRRAVEKALKDALKMDRAKIQLSRISAFGLLEMSRQRLRPSISETSMIQCEHCVGRGVVRSNESMSIQMIRTLEKEASTGSWSGLRLILPQQVALHLLNSKRDMLKNIEQNYNLTIQVLIDSDMTMSEFNLEKMRRSPTDRQAEQNKDKDKKNSKRRTRGGKKNTTDKNELEDSNEASDDGNDESEEKRGRSRRGRRGGRGRRKNNSDSAENQHENEAAKENDSDQQPEEKSEAGPDKPKHAPAKGRKKKDEDATEDRSKLEDRSKTSQANDNTSEDANKLPSFAKEKAEYSAPVRAPEDEKVAAIHSAPVTPRDPNAPAKKGWWQKMIQLDD